MKNEFVFAYDTSVIEPDGNFFIVLVTVFDPNDFEIWDPNRDRPVDLAALPLIDQAKILQIIQERSERRANVEMAFCESADRRWDIDEMNKSRGIFLVKKTEKKGAG